MIRSLFFDGAARRIRRRLLIDVQYSPPNTLSGQSFFLGEPIKISRVVIPKITLRTAVALVAALNLSYFGVEFFVALRIGSVSLFADSIDFLEDTSINLLILVALGWSAYKRSIVGMLLAAMMLVPGIATAWATWQKIGHPTPPDALALSLTGAGALIVNVSCALLLTAFRKHTSSLTRAAYLSARNDAVANIAIIGAGIVTAATVSGWPDIVVGIGIFLMNLDAAREVFSAARKEHVNAKT
jgi:Co/Zn/Cd efflux system component